MHAMHGIEEQEPDRLRSVARSDLPLIAEAQTRAPRPTADRLSVRLLATDERHPSVVALSVQGEVDIDTVPALRDVLFPVLEHRNGPVVVDLSEVFFMDSTGVHVLVDALQRVKPQNRTLAIVCREGGPVHRLLALVGLLDALTVHRSRESAATGGDDVLRSESAGNGRPTDVRALTHSLL